MEIMNKKKIACPLSQNIKMFTQINSFYIQKLYHIGGIYASL